MDKLFTLEYGIGGVCVLLTIQVLVRVAEFVMKTRAQKEELSEKTVKELVLAVKTLETTVADLPKFKTDIRRFYAAIKHVSGDRWPAIRDEIMKDETLT